MNGLALLLLVRESSGSFSSAGLVVACYSLATAGVAPVLGALVDRLGPRAVLIPSAAGHGLGLAALVAACVGDASTPVLLPLAAGAGALSPPIGACARSAWPLVTAGPASREAAYALDATTQEVIWTAGPLIVGAAIGLASPAAAVVLGAAISVGGTAWFATAPALARARRPAAPAVRVSALSSSPLRPLLLAGLMLGLSVGAVEVGLPALAVREHSPDASGVLLAAWSFGSLLGGLAYGLGDWPAAREVRLPWLLGLVALLTAPLVMADSVVGALALSALAGVAQAPAFACQYSLIGGLAPTGAATEAFAWSTATLVVGIAAGVALAGALVEWSGPGAAFATGALAALAAATFAAAVRLRVRRAGTPTYSPGGSGAVS